MLEAVADREGRRVEQLRAVGGLLTATLPAPLLPPGGVPRPRAVQAEQAADHRG